MTPEKKCRSCGRRFATVRFDGNCPWCGDTDWEFVHPQITPDERVLFRQIEAQVYAMGGMTS